MYYMYEVSGELTAIWWLQEKVRERLAVSKQEAQKFDGEKFNLRNLNVLEVEKQVFDLHFGELKS